MRVSDTKCRSRRSACGSPASLAATAENAGEPPALLVEDPRGGGTVLHAGRAALTVLALGLLNPQLINASQPSGPSSPEDELASFRLADGRLTVELVAAEPNVISPVAITWDADGRMFVAEMMDYPLGPGTGQIRMLEDLDADGRYEKATIFTDKLPFPNGVFPWKGGLLVTAAPNIWFLKDNDGDGRAEERRVLFTGFGEGNQQLRVNGLTWGLDNWIYGANGRNDGEVQRPENPVTNSVSIRRRDFRFRPDTLEFEAIAGPSQFGLGRDDWGNRFLSWNTIPVRHAVVDEKYLNRNPHWPATEAIRNLLPPGDTGQVFPLTPPPLVFNSESSSQFNALAGLAIYRGGALGEDYRGDAFVGESLRNLIHRRILEPDGVTFVARRAEEGKEFLASTDPWFHPVNFATGPDGALYAVDFYRQFVEHPLYVPEGLRNSQPWRTGAEYGRIWRIQRNVGQASRLSQPSAISPKIPSSLKQPANQKGRRDVRPTLSRATAAELVEELGDQNAWRRDTAQRLLVERQDPSAIPILKSALRNPRSAFPLARLHALWTLDGIDAMDGDMILRALRDEHPRIREHAVRLAEEFLERSAAFGSGAMRDGKPPGIAPYRKPALGDSGSMVLTSSQQARIHRSLLGLAGDSDARVRFQLALTLGVLRPTNQLAALTRLARLGVRSRLEALAILGGAGGESMALLRALIQRDRGWLKSPTEEQGAFLEEIGRAIGSARQEPGVKAMLALLSDSASLSGSLRLFSGLAEGMGQSDQSVRAWLAHGSGPNQNENPPASRFTSNAVAVALGASQPLSLRRAAIRVLALSPDDRAGAELHRLSLEDSTPDVRVAAVRAIVESGGSNLVAALLTTWTKLSTAQRRQTLAAAARSSNTLGALLDAMERGDVQTAEMDAASRQRLQQTQDAGLRSRIEKLFGKANAADRPEALRNFQAALRLPGDPARGALTFGRLCLQCHSVQGTGGKVGPDLTGVASRPKEALLADILDPSQQIAPDFLSYRVVTRTGEMVSGLIAAESAASLTLRRVNEPDVTMPRRDVSQVQAEGKSAMPEGLEQGLSLQDMADLLEFLRKPAKALLPR